MFKGSERLRELVRENTVLRAYLLFLYIAHIVQEYANDHLYRQVGISEVQYRALGHIVINGGSIRPSELSKQLSRVQHNTTTLIDRLRAGGLVTTERDNGDRRYVNINVTDKGREVYIKTYPVAREIVNQVMSSISEEDAVKLEELLSVIEQNILGDDLLPEK